MTIPLVPSVPAVDDVSTISSSTVNAWRANLAKALDGVGGGNYQPSAEIGIGGSGLRLNDGAKLGYSSRSIPRAQTSPLHNDDTGVVSLEGFIAVAPTETARQIIRCPHGASLTSVTVYHDRNDAVGMPGTRVSAALKKTRITNGTVSTLVPSTEDPTSVEVDYELHHGFTLTLGSPETISATDTMYYVEVYGETGGGTLSTTVWFGAVATFTVTSQDEAP